MLLRIHHQPRQSSDCLYSLSVSKVLKFSQRFSKSGSWVEQQKTIVHRSRVQSLAVATAIHEQKWPCSLVKHECLASLAFQIMTQVPSTFIQMFLKTYFLPIEEFLSTMFRECLWKISPFTWRVVFFVIRKGKSYLKMFTKADQPIRRQMHDVNFYISVKPWE